MGVPQNGRHGRHNPNLDSTHSKIKVEDLEMSKKTLVIWNNPLDGNNKHCEFFATK